MQSIYGLRFYHWKYIQYEHLYIDRDIYTHLLIAGFLFKCYDVVEAASAWSSFQCSVWMFIGECRFYIRNWKIDRDKIAKRRKKNCALKRAANSNATSTLIPNAAVSDRFLWFTSLALLIAVSQLKWSHVSLVIYIETKRLERNFLLDFRFNGCTVRRPGSMCNCIFTNFATQHLMRTNEELEERRRERESAKNTQLIVRRYTTMILLRINQ